MNLLKMIISMDIKILKNSIKKFIMDYNHIKIFSCKSNKYLSFNNNNLHKEFVNI